MSLEELQRNKTEKKLLYELAQDHVVPIEQFLRKTGNLESFTQDVTSPMVFYDYKDFPVMTITPAPDYQIIVHKGYRWDGCSLKISVLDLFWVGTPDGIAMGKELITHRASAVHDVLGYCKHVQEMPQPFRAQGDDLWQSPGRDARDILFLELLRADNFLLSYPYYLAVFTLGPLFDRLNSYLAEIFSKKGEKLPYAKTS